jgi:hypothetical protein
VINHIDVSSVLRRTVCDLYSNLVTRPTGAAVRTEIENLVAERGEPVITVIDFSHVGLLDFSCADEVVAKLLLRHVGVAAKQEAYFLVRGVREAHLDAIESVLERYGLALVIETDAGAPKLVGNVDDGERRLWETLVRMGRAAPSDVAVALEEELGAATRRLCAMHDRRLIMRLADEYMAVGPLE